MIPTGYLHIALLSCTSTNGAIKDDFSLTYSLQQEMFGDGGFNARARGAVDGGCYGSVDQSLVTMASRLESEVKQQGASIEDALYNIRAIDSRIPSIERTLDDHRRSLERGFVDIPGMVGPLEDDASQVRAALDQFSKQTNSRLQSLRTRLEETSNIVTQLESRCQNLTGTTRTAMNALDNELMTSKQTLSLAAQRLVELESGLVDADPILRDLQSEIEKQTRIVRDKISQFQTETSGTFTTAVAQLEDELKNEKKMRVDTVGQIDQQLEDVHRSTTDAVAKMTSFLTSTKTQYQEALMNLSSKAKAGAQECGSASNDVFSHVSSRIDQFVKDSGAQFQALESDIASTIDVLEKHILATRDNLENTIASVSMARVQAETDAVAQYDQLKLTITNLLREQVEYIESTSEHSVSTVTDHCARIISQIQMELGQVKEQSQRIARLENRMAHLGAAAEQTRYNLVEQIHSLGQMYMDLQASVQNIETEFEQRQAAIEERIARLEDPDHQTTYASRSEVDGIVQRARGILDGRLQEIEQQLGQLLQSIATITMTSSRASQKSRQSGQEMLSEMVARTSD